MSYNDDDGDDDDDDDCVCDVSMTRANDWIPIASVLNGCVRFIQFQDVMTSLHDSC